MTITFITSDKYASVKRREAVTIKNGVFTALTDADNGAVFIEKGAYPWECKSLSIKERLMSLPDVVQVEKITKVFQEFPDSVYRVVFSLPIDHENPSVGRFNNESYIGIRHLDSLNVVSITGYEVSAPEPNQCNVLTLLLNSNEIFLEHRDFAESSTGTDYAYLTTAQAAADQKQMIDRYQLMFKRRCAVTGASKGGVCTALLAGYYPDFNAVYVCDVAPFCTQTDDLKGHKFYLEQVGTAQMRARVLETQRKMLVLKDSTDIMKEFKQMVEQYATDLSASLTDIFYYTIQDYGSYFWQSGGNESDLPDESLSGRELWDIISIAGIFPMVVRSLGPEIRPYTVQSLKELGSFGYCHNMSDIYVPVQTSCLLAMLPEKYHNLEYNHGATYEKYIFQAVSKTDKPMMFIYGGQDGWTQNALDDKYVNGTNILKYVIPGVSHQATITMLPEPEKTKAIDWLKKNMYK